MNKVTQFNADMSAVSTQRPEAGAEEGSAWHGAESRLQKKA